MGYRIRKHTKNKAKKLGVEVKISKNKGKKIDVFRNGKKIASVGGSGYNDYPTYLELETSGKVPKGTAAKKRAAYKARHIYRSKKGTNAYWADQLLW
jgi:hypothetical protein